ncbi:Peroxiredoxin [Nonomuraea maritima]|uniref:Peroxiredoxin n=1 Tax=Nonomuraea maritima TaxID=683260 RepID=A0A1G9P246_9ACTN|nr:TlpA disulfide reductase family protein [Nonomuraea maritima]SDL92962.1 Peroxiredoxin [Nonomuraea maritima]
MAVMWAAIVLVGAVCALDLVLTLGVVRRLKEHTAHLERLLQGGPAGAALEGTLPTVGATVGEFTATTLDGEEIARSSLSGETLVAFFSPGCAPCVEKLPGFLAHARERIGGRSLILAIVAPGEPAATAEMTAELRQVATVVVDEDFSDGVANAFSVTEYPAFCLVDSEGTVLAVERDVARLAAPAER